MAKGCDYSWARPNLNALRGAGITFACRYLSYDRSGKNLTRAEALRLQGTGIAPVSNWEWQERDVLGGRARGVQHARDAAAQHAACGGPLDRPIYFSVDFDLQPADVRQAAAYFDGVNSVIGAERTGVYGGLFTVSSMFATNRAKWIWQTSAWSRGQWHPRAHIRQVSYGVWVGGGQVDIDQSFGQDFGQWGAVAPTGGERNVETGDYNMRPWLEVLGTQMGGAGNILGDARTGMGQLFH
jgi:Domain of unknown function (DUF1906)